MSSDQHYGWLGRDFTNPPFTKQYNAYGMSLVGFDHRSYWSYTEPGSDKRYPRATLSGEGGGVWDVQGVGFKMRALQVERSWLKMPWKHGNLQNSLLWKRMYHLPSTENFVDSSPTFRIDFQVEYFGTGGLTTRSLNWFYKGIRGIRGFLCFKPTVTLPETNSSPMKKSHLSW